MNNHLKQELKMRGVLFWVILGLFISIVILTILSLFFGLGQLADKYKETLFYAFIIEIASAIFSLFYYLFQIKKTPVSESISINKSDLPKQKFDAIFEAKNSLDFYNKIAKKYDERNTKFLKQTHQCVIKEVDNYVKDQEYAMILDLGGGTGRLIAHYFFNRDNLEWIYADNSPTMLEQFKMNMENTDLKTRNYLADIYNLTPEILGDT